MHGKFKKAVMPYFKLKSHAEKSHDKLKMACVLIEIRFRQAYCTNSIMYQYVLPLKNVPVSCAVASSGKRSVEAELW
jgi:hypothetical protein